MSAFKIFHTKVKDVSKNNFSLQGIFRLTYNEMQHSASNITIFVLKVLCKTALHVGQGGHARLFKRDAQAHCAQNGQQRRHRHVLPVLQLVQHRAAAARSGGHIHRRQLVVNAVAGNGRAQVRDEFDFVHDGGHF